MGDSCRIASRWRPQSVKDVCCHLVSSLLCQTGSLRFQRKGEEKAYSGNCGHNLVILMMLTTLFCCLTVTHKCQAKPRFWHHDQLAQVSASTKARPRSWECSMPATAIHSRTAKAKARPRSRECSMPATANHSRTAKAKARSWQHVSNCVIVGQPRQRKDQDHENAAC